MDLNSLVWENKIDGMLLDQWLNNFQLDSEKKLALEILSKFTYYNEKEIWALLKSAYHLLKNEIQLILKQERSSQLVSDFLQNDCYFVGTWENPSKSGIHMLYNFRKSNVINPDLFKLTVSHVPSDAKYVVFVDDIVGSGRTSSDFWEKQVIKDAIHLKSAKFLYLSLVGTKKGIYHVETSTGIKAISAVELDDRYSVFSNNSIYFDNSTKKDAAKQMCEKYGKKLVSGAPLGYDDSQLLVGFHHNVPDNTLPIIWADVNNWMPIFPRNDDVI